MTDTATAPRQDVEILLELDFEPTPVCEFRRNECGAEATHTSLWTCGCIQLFCTEHAHYIVRRTASFWFCSLCQSTGSQLITINAIR